MSNYIAIGTKVYIGQQQPAPEPTEENPNPVAPARKTGTVKGVQDHEPPVSYLVEPHGDSQFGAAWFPDHLISVIPEGEEIPAQAEPIAIEQPEVAAPEAEA